MKRISVLWCVVCSMGRGVNRTLMKSVSIYENILMDGLEVNK